MKKITFIISLITAPILWAQTTTYILSANGDGNTYEDINAIFAPNGGDAIEAPGITPSGDCINHDDFDNGETSDSNRHIQEVVDPELGNVFKFSIHVDNDIDRDKCETTDRQRNEIKTYASSPDYLLGTLGETVEYKWSFKIPAGFQSSGSFTHIHQLKSVGGISSEESIPMITLTIYDNSSDHKLYVRYSETDSQSTISDHNVDISDLEDNWVEVTETVTYGYEGQGAFAITITDMDTNEILLNYTDNTQRYYKTDATFMRPKWGIYRSLNDAASLRDEEILYGSFSISETPAVLSNDDYLIDQTDNSLYPNPSKEVINLPFSDNSSNKYSLKIYDSLGGLVINKEKLISNIFHIKQLAEGIYFVKLVNNSNQTSTIEKLIKL